MGAWNREDLDVVLVPSGLVLMAGYHLLLLRRYYSVTAQDKHYRGTWAEKMLEVDVKDRGPAIQVINNNITAAFSLASISLIVSSLIGTWFGNSTPLPSTLIYGDTSQSIMAYKHISLLICFLVAFASFLQSARCYIHSSFLITMPNVCVKKEYVQDAVVYGSNCWSVGMRALYFAITLLLWVFGPIPMFVSSVVMVVVLYKLDWNATTLLQITEAEGLVEKIEHEVTAALGKVIGHARGRAEHHGDHRGVKAELSQIENNELEPTTTRIKKKGGYPHVLSLMA
ncbi:hypothetical protein Vadar_000741 [Vaccinium darrowii]|uniref:Uncharacterized protein n=1 Tax=Vaccinium darrowii TaxID=229202 RepID=A0ACB7XMD1_9ERIC|nr:hypothetical protein Vadar_000741 [Vaccinium darrowii]